MANTRNELDIFLQSQSVRLNKIESNYISLAPSSLVIRTTAIGTNPNSVVVNAFTVGELIGNVTWSTTNNVGSITNNTITIDASEVLAGQSVEVTASLEYLGHTYSATTTVSHVADSVSSTLSTEAIVIPTNADGSGGIYVNASTTMSITIGSLDSSAGWSYSWSLTSGTATATFSNNNRTLTIDSLSTDSATYTCTASKEGWPDQQKVFKISKAKAGIVGTRTATIRLYKLAVVKPTTNLPTGTSTYTWSTATFTTNNVTLNGWAQEPPSPAKGETLWEISKVFTDATTNTTTNVSWAGAVVSALSSSGVDGSTGPGGANGSRTAVLQMYKWASTKPTSSFPSGTSTYTWSTGSFTAPSTTNSWSIDPPTPVAGQALWVIKRVYVDTDTTAQTSISWSGVSSSNVTPVAYAGTNGSTGANGVRGSVNIYVSGSVWSDSVANTAVTDQTGSSTKVLGDTVTISNGTTFAATKYWSGGLPGSWISPGTVIDGNLLVSGTLSANKITFGTMSGQRIESGTLSAAAISNGTTQSSSDGLFRVGGASLLGNISSGIVMTSIAGSVDRAGVSAVNSSSNIPAITGVTQSYNGWGIGAYYLTGLNADTKRSQFVAANGTYGCQAELWNSSGVSSTNIRLAALVGGVFYSGYSTDGVMNVVDGFAPFTGIHDGIMCDIPDIGDILVDKEVLKRDSISAVSMKYEVSSIPNQKGVIGVYSEAHDIPPEGWDNVPEGYKVVHVNALGEGLINVCGENGNIERGDLIVTSSIPGKGMKQNDDIIRSYTVAKAREPVVFSSPTEVKQVACIYLSG